MSFHASYNAVVVGRELITPNLVILKIRPDKVGSPFKAGQFATLGLYSNAFLHPDFKKYELDNSDKSEDLSPQGLPSNTDSPEVKMLRRAYSICSEANHPEELEFYIALVSSGKLSPLLFSLSLGDRVYMADRIAGHFVLTEAMKGSNLVLVANGTGISPFISMCKEDAFLKHYETVTVIHGARTPEDLGYRDFLEKMSEQGNNFRYIPIISRPQDSSITWTGHVGRIPHLCRNENLLSRGSPSLLDPTRAHYFLCGNAGMIGDMTDFLSSLGFVPDKGVKNPGTIHKEEYF